MDFNSFATMFVGLFAITAQIAAVPIFVASTDGQTGEQQRKTALIATATYVIGGLIALFVGNALLGFFGVTVAALRVAGMAVVAAIGWQMLNKPTPSADGAAGSEAADGRGEPQVAGARQAPMAHLHAASNTRVAIADQAVRGQVPSPSRVGIMPLGFPIYAGPGVLSVIIGWGSGTSQVYVAALVAILANAAIIVVLDFLATPITKVIGTEALMVTEKIFGLIVVAIAVTGMASALSVLFPGLAGGIH